MFFIILSLIIILCILFYSLKSKITERKHGSIGTCAVLMNHDVFVRTNLHSRVWREYLTMINFSSINYYVSSFFSKYPLLYNKNVFSKIEIILIDDMDEYIELITNDLTSHNSFYDFDRMNTRYGIVIDIKRCYTNKYNNNRAIAQLILHEYFHILNKHRTENWDDEHSHSDWKKLIL